MAVKKKKTAAAAPAPSAETPKPKKQDKGSFSIFIAKKVPTIDINEIVESDEVHAIVTGDVVLKEIAKGLMDMKDANTWLKKNGASLNKQRIIIAHVKADSVVKTETEIKITFG